jgi:hypothetical protein
VDKLLNFPPRPCWFWREILFLTTDDTDFHRWENKHYRFDSLAMNDPKIGSCKRRITYLSGFICDICGSLFFATDATDFHRWDFQDLIFGGHYPQPSQKTVPKQAKSIFITTASIF